MFSIAVLMDKGIIIGVEHETAIRSNLPFVMFRHTASVSFLVNETKKYLAKQSRHQSHLFLQHILLYHLENNQVKEAVEFASHYKNLVFFAHALEVLLHTVVESDVAAISSNDREANETYNEVLPTVIEFLDHFDVSLDVIVGCARKTELTRWRHLFNIVGNPKGLFEVCAIPLKLEQ